MAIESWRDIAEAIAGTAADYVPILGAALLLVLTGWLLAHLGRFWTRRLIQRLLERLGGSTGPIGQAVENSGARSTTPRLVAGFVFWAVLLVFVAAAVETLGLPVVTELLGKTAAYMPKLLAASLIVLGGMICARIVRSGVLRAAEGGGISQANAIAVVAEFIVVILAAVVALEQLGVNGRVLELTVAVIVGSVLAAAALAFGLGARSSVENLIAAHYVARLIQVGDLVEIGDQRGRVVELTTTAVVLETPRGRVLVPAHQFHDAPSTIVTEED